MKRSIIILLGLAVALLIADRYVRIQPYVQRVRSVTEPFQMPPLGSRRCGVGLPRCSEKCGNGICISTEPKPLVEKNPLSVLP